MAAVGVVGCGTRAGSAADQVAISLAGAFCLPARYRRVSLHGVDAVCFDRLVDRQIIGPNEKHILSFADAPWSRSGLRIVRACVACDPGCGAGFRSRIATDLCALAMACSASCSSGTDHSIMDGEVDRFFVSPDA